MTLSSEEAIREGFFGNQEVFRRILSTKSSYLQGKIKRGKVSTDFVCLAKDLSIFSIRIKDIHNQNKRMRTPSLMYLATEYRNPAG